MKTLERRKKEVTIFSWVLIIMGFFMIVLFPTARAWKPAEIAFEMALSLVDGVGPIILCAIGGDASSTEGYGVFAFLNSFYSTVTDDNFTTSVYLSNGTNIIKTIAAFWVIGVAISHIFTNLERGTDPMEVFFKFFLELCVTGVFILQIDNIMSTLTSLGEVLAGALKTTAEGAAAREDAADTLLEALTGHRLLETLLAILQLFVPFILSWGAKLFALVMVMTLLFEIGIRKFFAPLAVTDIYQDGLRSSGARYLKKYIACYMKLLIAAVIVATTNACFTNLMDFHPSRASEAIGKVLCVAGIGYAQLMCVKQSSNWVNDVAGV